ncbi:MAG: hypothetical protein JWP75_2148 [Frondihabitans sp.]|nr:hypothetical protein [Frondihabitans sp.]
MTGIMAHRILTGQSQYVYLASQNYNGSLEQYLQAGLYFVTRLPENPFTLRLVEVALTAITTFVVFLVGRVVFVKPWPAVLASALFAAGPYARVYLGTRSYGSYDVTQLFALLAILFALRAAGFAKNRERRALAVWPRAVWLGLFGLCVGLTLWLGLTGLEILLPVSLWILPVLARSWRGVLLGAAGIIIGVFPALAWFVTNPRAPLGVGGPQPSTTLSDRVSILQHLVGHQYLGLNPFQPHWLTPAVYLAIVVFFIVGVVLRARGLLSIFTFRMAPRLPGDVILFVIPVAVLIYLGSPFSWYVGTPRYLFVLFPVTSIAFAMVFHWVSVTAVPKIVHSTWRISTFRAALALSAAVLIVVSAWQTVWVTHHALAGARALVTDQQLQTADRYLVAHHLDNVYAEYWTALPAQYFAEATVRLGTLHIAPWGVGQGKVGVTTSEVNASRQFVYLTASRLGLPDANTLLAAFARHHITFKTTRIGPVTVYTELSRQLRPAELGLAGS